MAARVSTKRTFTCPHNPKHYPLGKKLERPDEWEILEFICLTPSLHRNWADDPGHTEEMIFRLNGSGLESRLKALRENNQVQTGVQQHVATSSSNVSGKWPHHASAGADGFSNPSAHPNERNAAIRWHGRKQPVWDRPDLAPGGPACGHASPVDANGISSSPISSITQLSAIQWHSCEWLVWERPDHATTSSQHGPAGPSWRIQLLYWHQLCQSLWGPPGHVDGGCILGRARPGRLDKSPSDDSRSRQWRVPIPRHQPEQLLWE